MWRIKQFIRKLKSLFDRARLGFPKIVECNVCGWQGRHFVSDSWHLYITCPNCYSKIRHRLLAAALAHIKQISYQKIIQNKCILHFAPEDMISTIIKRKAAFYLTADLKRKNVDIFLDISNMPQIEENSFDAVIACDVLEHVEKETLALQEIYRILAVGGYAVLTAPQKDNLSETFEDSTVKTPGERKRLFGQYNHVRIYGNDFHLRLESAGFKVTTVNESNFCSETVKKHVLFPPILSDKPLATNYRKIFFARKV